MQTPALEVASFVGAWTWSRPTLDVPIEVEKLSWCCMISSSISARATDWCPVLNVKPDAGAKDGPWGAAQVGPEPRVLERVARKRRDKSQGLTWAKKRVARCQRSINGQ